MPLLDLSFASGEDSLSVRRFSVCEAVSGLFSVSVWACSRDADLDLERILGKAAGFRVLSGLAFARLGGARRWTGVCSYIEQVQPEPTGLSTYCLRIVPSLWLLTQRRNYRIFQLLNVPQIVDKLLSEWRISPAWALNRDEYPKLDYKVQYGESDYVFLCRLLEEAGISFTFPEGDEGNVLTFGDALQRGDARPTPPIPWVDNPSEAAEQEFVTQVRLSHEVRPATYTIRDHDFRKPRFPLFGAASALGDADGQLHEQYHYRPGAFLIELEQAGDTPIADDRAVARSDHRYGDTRAERALDGARAGRRSIAFDTNVIDLRPGVVFSIGGHPHAELAEAARLLVTESTFQGSHGGAWTTSCRAVFADDPFRPALVTPKPNVSGVQTATVVGPEKQEIHTDEFGRVRVQFPWDREGKHDEFSSCWIRVSQGWAGTGYGMITIPRIGQEVLVGFVEGDPDQPMVVGRVFNATELSPYKLPDHKTRSTWKSDSSLGSDGSNEIMFEDLKYKELVYLQAQKNLRKLVKNDETITVGRNRQKYVLANETETTGANRVEVTGANRTEITDANRTTTIGGSASKLVGGDETEKTDGALVVLVGGDQDIVVKQNKRERIEGESHLIVGGKRNQTISGTQSLTVKKDRQEVVLKNYALDVGEEIHIKAGASLVIEAAKDLTLKGPGGFIRIDGDGVTIKGTVVRINSGGSAGSGRGASPEEPDEALEAVVVEPERPVPDNILITGLSQ